MMPLFRPVVATGQELGRAFRALEQERKNDTAPVVEVRQSGTMSAYSTARCGRNRVRHHTDFYQVWERVGCWKQKTARY
jgi:hypothetical protein